MNKKLYHSYSKLNKSDKCNSSPIDIVLNVEIVQFIFPLSILPICASGISARLANSSCDKPLSWRSTIILLPSFFMNSSFLIFITYQKEDFLLKNIETSMSQIETFMYF